MNGGGVIGALVFVIGVLAAFALLFGLFLIVPFFIFLGGIVAMMISDRKRNRGREDEENTEDVVAEETTTEVTEVRS